MTADEINQYKERVGKTDLADMVTLHGYTSTSLQKSVALTFAWEEPNTGHQKVLFHFKWMSKWEAYFLDAGAFDHEKEVLLNDGADLIVESVEEITNDK